MAAKARAEERGLTVLPLIGQQKGEFKVALVKKVFGTSDTSDAIVLSTSLPNFYPTITVLEDAAEFYWSRGQLPLPLGC